MPDYTTIRGRASAEVEIKKSRFIGQIAHAQSEDEALAFLEEVRAANRMAKHNVYAYILREGGAGTAGRIRYSDDGEPAKTAGLPTLNVLQGAGLFDVCCVVTRYFGGTLLGTGGLVRAYTEATQKAIEAARAQGLLTVISRCVDIHVRVPYALYDQLMHIAGAAGAKTVDTQYAEDVQVTLRMLDGTQQTLLASLAELLHGLDAVQVGDPFDAAF
jgi:uncharacterized YigZ family protein